MTQSTPAQVWSSLPPETRAALTETNTWAGVKHLILHIGVIAALATYVALGAPFWGLALLPLGVALAFLFTLQHECTHRTPFASDKLSDLVGLACGLILIQPFYWFRAFHMAHHKHTGDPDKDPELQGDAKPESWRAMAWHLGSLGYWADKAKVLIALATGSLKADYIAPRSTARLTREARTLMALYGVAALFTVTVSPVLLWIWLIPLSLGFPVLRLYLLAEHGRCPPVANMFLNTRTTLTSRLVRFVAWNMPYHAEHHAFPQVPFHNLPKAHKETRPHLGTLTNGYSAFARDYAATFEQTSP